MFARQLCSGLHIACVVDDNDQLQIPHATSGSNWQARIVQGCAGQRGMEDGCSDSVVCDNLGMKIRVCVMEREHAFDAKRVRNGSCEGGATTRVDGVVAGRACDKDVEPEF